MIKNIINSISYIKISGAQLCLITILLVSPIYSAWAETSVTIYFHGRGINDELQNSRFSKSLALNLSKILQHPIFQKNDPGPLGLIVDGDWQASEGYFSADLKTPDGMPAILLQRNALINEAAQARLLTHELFHMIHHQKRPHEEPWVQEGLALLTEYLVTGHFNRALLAGFQLPETSLTDGFEFHDRATHTKSQTLAQYGHALQYFTYLYRLCGGDALYTALLSSNSAATGIRFVDETLKIIGSTQTLDPICASFEVSFRAFQKARFFPGIASAAAYVISPDLGATIRPAFTPLKGAATMPRYSARVFTQGKLEIRLE